MAAAGLMNGALRGDACAARDPFRGEVPWFVPEEYFAGNFGFEWKRSARTQYDETGGIDQFGRPFFAKTQGPATASGEWMLEMGNCLGHVTAVAAKTGAFVVSTDYIAAAAANNASNRVLPNIFLVQEKLCRLPFSAGIFNTVLCLGVLQHTLDMPAFLKPGGRIAVVVCAKMRGTVPFLLRLISTHNRVRAKKRMFHDQIYSYCERHVKFIWPLVKRLGWLGQSGAFFLRRLLFPPFFGVLNLQENRLRNWIALDVFDALSPANDHPQFIDKVDKWFRERGRTDLDVVCGYNGINGRGWRPVSYD